MDSARIWSQSTARRALMGYERTNNPTPSAARLLGKARVKRAERVLKRKGKKRAHRGNPLPAVAGLAGGLLGGKLANRLKSPEQRHAERVAVADALAARAALGDAAALVELERLSREFATKRGQDYAKQKLAEVKAGHRTATSAGMNPLAQIGASLASPQGLGVIRTIAGAAKKPRRAARGRYPTYVDRQGRQRYSTKPPGTELRIPQGATPTPGTPYNFFQGAVGKGGAAATAGQFAVAGAAGIGAYLVTRKLLQYLGGGAQRKEEAGVAAARALHESLEEYKANTGKYPPPAERARMKEAYRAQLVKLGYNPDTFTRTRSGVESFLEDYNPLGG